MRFADSALFTQRALSSEKHPSLVSHSLPVVVINIGMDNLESDTAGYIAVLRQVFSIRFYAKYLK